MKTEAKPRISARWRRRLRFIGYVGLVALAGLLGATAWWATSLNALPDVGDPFDVAAFRAQVVPADDNAFVLYRQAESRAAEYKDRRERNARSKQPLALVTWSKADEGLRHWVRANAQAMELFRQGTERTQASLRPAGEFHSREFPFVNPRPFAEMAFLEGSRLEEARDFAGAWRWYRTVMRMTTHYGMSGDSTARFIAQIVRGWLKTRVLEWAANPAVDSKLLRKALDDTVACAPHGEWDIVMLKRQYLVAMRQLEQPDEYLGGGDPEVRTLRIGDLQLTSEPERWSYAFRRFMRREPERSRRVLRLLFANWLAHAEAPVGHRPKPALQLSFRSWNSNWSLMLYETNASAPASARALPPTAVANWFLSTYDAKTVFVNGDLGSAIGERERATHRALVIGLAEELFRREHGRAPASESELVGTCVPSLPEVDDVDLGAVPTMDEPHGSREGRVED
jgi:hypothetical protein